MLFLSIPFYKYSLPETLKQVENLESQERDEMEYVDSENGKLIGMEKNGINNGPNGSDNFENGYDGKNLIYN